MNAKELQALRKLLMLDVGEAARIIGKVSARSWQYWEAGRSNVPDDVADLMNALLTQRQAIIEAIEHRVRQHSEAPDDEHGQRLQLPFYSSLEEYQKDHPEEGSMAWRAYQSAVAELYAKSLVNLT